MEKRSNLKFIIKNSKIKRTYIFHNIYIYEHSQIHNLSSYLSLINYRIISVIMEERYLLHIIPGYIMIKNNLSEKRFSAH
jgi:hypothetical protein